MWFYNEDEIATLIRNGFQELFTSSAVSVLRGSWDILSWSSHMSPEGLGVKGDLYPGS